MQTFTRISRAKKCATRRVKKDTVITIRPKIRRRPSPVGLEACRCVDVYISMYDCQIILFAQSADTIPFAERSSSDFQSINCIFLSQYTSSFSEITLCAIVEYY